jgi:hypothetical protein
MLSYIYYLLGYEEEVKADEVSADPKQVNQRHKLHKQINHTAERPIKLKSPPKDDIPEDMTKSVYLAPAIPVGKVLDDTTLIKELQKQSQSWSDVVAKKKKRLNRFDVLVEHN